MFLFLDLLSRLGFSKIYQFHISGNHYSIEIKWSLYGDILQISNTFLCKTSIAVCKAIALMSVFWSAAVKYMWISKNLCWPASSASCSSSNWFKSLKNHSNDFWSRLIQKKSTLNKIYVIQHYNSIIPFLQYVNGNITKSMQYFLNNLSQILTWRMRCHIFIPLQATSWTFPFYILVSIHNGLKNCRKWSDPDSSSN